jgi:pilus assembly protein CpaC
MNRRFGERTQKAQNRIKKAQKTYWLVAFLCFFGIPLCFLWSVPFSLGNAVLQEPAVVQQEPATRPAGPATPLPSRALTVTVGRGQLLQFANEAARVSVSDSAIADAVVVSPHEVILNGKSPGHTTIMIWHGENVSPFEVTVEPDLTEVQTQLRATFPSERIEISSSRDAILLTGVVSDAEIAKQAGAIAAVHARSIVNLLQSPPPDSRQVMLQVKFATVDRTTLSQLGANFFSVNSALLGTSSTQQFPFPRIGQLQFSQGPDGQQVLGNQQVTVTDLLNLFVFRPDINVGATLRLLQNNNLLQILAEPNLVTVSGREASFLAGGEFPFPVVTTTGSGAQTAPVVSVQFREFGVRLFFTPTVDPSGLIHLKVRPEVSALDFANALTIQGFLIPAISTRRAETEVDLREGESFAIAGLIDNRAIQVANKIPGIGDLPILGHLFRSRSTQRSNSELLVVITPTFVKPFAAGQTPGMPQFPLGFMESEKTPAPPAFVGPRGNVPPGANP